MQCKILKVTLKINQLNKPMADINNYTTANQRYSACGKQDNISSSLPYS